MPKKKISKVKSSGLPRELTEVTPVSKSLAFIVFIILPIATFFLGIRYQEWFDMNQNAAQNSSPVVAPAQTTVDVQNVTPPPSCYFGSSCMGITGGTCKKILVCPQGGRMVPYTVTTPQGY